MNKTLKAADEVKKLHRMFAALGEVVEVLDRVGSLEQAENEAQARITKLNAERELHEKAIASVKGQAKEMLDTADAQARRVIEEAHAAAARITADTEAAALNARQEAAALVEQAKAQVAAAEAQAAQAAEATKQAEDELRVLDKKIDDARGKIAKLLGS